MNSNRNFHKAIDKEQVTIAITKIISNMQDELIELKNLVTRLQADSKDKSSMTNEETNEEGGLTPRVMLAMKVLSKAGQLE